MIVFCPRNSNKKILVLFIMNSRIWFIYDSLLGFTEFQKFIKNKAVKKDFLGYSVLTFQWLSFARRTAAAATRKLSSRTRKVGKIGASLDSRLMYWIPILYFFPLSAFGCHNDKKSFLELHSKVYCTNFLMFKLASFNLRLQDNSNFKHASPCIMVVSKIQ